MKNKQESSCPFRAFSLHRLHAEPMEAFSSGLSRMARGSAIHRALEFLYQEMHSKKQLESLEDPELDAICETAATQASVAGLSPASEEVGQPDCRQRRRPGLPDCR